MCGIAQQACPSRCRLWEILPSSQQAWGGGFEFLSATSWNLLTSARASMRRLGKSTKTTHVDDRCLISRFETPPLYALVEFSSFCEVRALVTVGETIITALKSDIVVWHKLTEVGRFRGHHFSATVLCAVGSTYLLSAAKHELILWQLSDIGNRDAETSIDSEKSILGPLGRPKLSQTFGEVSCICHPPTYLNKVLVAGSGGQLELWNIRSMERIHSFKCLSTSDSQVPITSMKEANALDVVAIGFATGRIALMNIREDRILFEAGTCSTSVVEAVSNISKRLLENFGSLGFCYCKLFSCFSQREVQAQQMASGTY